MANSGGISGVAVALASAGAVLVYAGFRGVSPLQALRDATSGKPPGVAANPTNISTANRDTGTGGSASGFTNSNLRNNVVANAKKYSGDQYSQLKRTQPGFSDCSSFVDKALKDSGINPPQSAWASTANFRLSPDWRTIPFAQAQPGDIAISATHMVLITSAGGQTAIGQQNPKRDVQEGTTKDLMANTGTYVWKTYKGYGGGSAGYGSGGGGGGSW